MEFDTPNADELGAVTLARVACLGNFVKNCACG
jgi:hypothetical protein